jgi:glycosyltransferase involved in cell wall biosynthesis
MEELLRATADTAAETRAPLLPGLSIVLPCYDEEANVADAIRAAASAAAAVSAEYEIVVVDDGSADATSAVAAKFVERDPRVRLIVHARNRGYGDALRSGLRAATMPWVLLTDADLQFDMHEVDDFALRADSADLIVGWRVMRQDPVRRRTNAAAWNWLVRSMFALPVHDVDCAFKLIRKDVLDSFELESSGAMISTELIVRSLAAGARVTELPVRHRPRVAGEQSGANIRVVLRAFRELARLRVTLRNLSQLRTV